MEPTKIENKLKDMLGKTFMYRQSNVKVLRFNVGLEDTRIVTDAKDISFSNANAKIKLEEFLPVSEEPGTSIAIRNSDFPDDTGSVHVSLPNLMINQQAKALNDIILRNIEMIEKDPEKINVAQAINDQVKSALDICKIEVEAMKVAAYVHKVHN